MKKIFLICLSFFISFLTYSQCSPFATCLNGSSGQAVDFTVTDLNGNSHNLYSYLDSGKVVVLEYLSTTCGHCISHAAYVEDFYEEWGPAGYDLVELIGLEININTDDAAVNSFISTYGLTNPVCNNINPVTLGYQLQYTPTFYVIYPDSTAVSVSGSTLSPYNQSPATVSSMLGDLANTWYNYVFGCTDPTATNYDSTATVDDGSCIFPSVCAVATNLNTTNVVHSRATFNWDNTGAEYYRIRVNTGSGWSILTQIGAADGFAHPNASKTRYFLTPNTTYEWQVRGWCLDGSVSNWSASATFSTLEECPNASNLGATDVEGEWATMTWDAPVATHGVDYYLARVREVGSSSWNIKGNIGNGLSKTIGSLAQGATYEFETRTWCNTGDANNPSDPYYKSDWGGNGQFTTVPCPVQTDNLAVTQLTATSADFSWTLISATPAADHFTIRFREVGATTWNYRSVAGGGTATGRTIGGFTSGVDYEWEVRTFCGVGSTWKSPWLAGPDFNLGSGARVNTPFSQLEVFPNPSRDIFNVSFVSDEIQNVTVKVVDVMGKVVYTEELTEYSGAYTNKINLSDYPKGVYFLRVLSDKGGIHKKVTLQ